MPHELPRTERRRQRPWQCQAFLAIRGVSRDAPELASHICTLNKDHFGVHLCWCGSAFNDLREVFTQRPLPGMTDGQRPYFSDDWPG